METIEWIVLMVFCIVPITIVIVINSLTEREKLKAETKRIRLENKIIEDITYLKLNREEKHNNIKNKIEIFEKLVKLEEQIKNKEGASDQKRLGDLEMIKKEFKETFVETKKAPKLVEEEKKLTSKKESGEELKKVKPAKPTLKNPSKKKKKIKTKHFNFLAILPKLDAFVFYSE